MFLEDDLVETRKQEGKRAKKGEQVKAYRLKVTVN